MTSPCPRSSCACSGRPFGSRIPSAVAARPRVAPEAVDRRTVAPLDGVDSAPPGEARRSRREVERRPAPAAKGANRSRRGRRPRQARGAGRALRCRRAPRATSAGSLESRFAQSPKARTRRRNAPSERAPRRSVRSVRATRTRPVPAPSVRARQRGLARAKAEPALRGDASVLVLPCSSRDSPCSPFGGATHWKP